MSASAALARSITWASSKQFYFTALILADRDLVDDCFRAYAYFRWADDIIDISLESSQERIAFIEGQKALIEKLYEGERPDDLRPEECILADLIANDRGTAGGLRSSITHFMAVLEFDAKRKGKLVGRHELEAYSTCLATAVMDGFQYIIANGHPYPRPPERIWAVIAAHITHMLRDMLNDVSVGYYNMPSEILESHEINPQDFDSQPLRNWVHAQVRLARDLLREGRRYIDALEVLRCKLAGFWYCTRFGRVLDAIERDEYTLRREYNERRRLAAWAEIAWLGVAVTLKHIAQRIRNAFYGRVPQRLYGSESEAFSKLLHEHDFDKPPLWATWGSQLCEDFNLTARSRALGIALETDPE